MALLVMVVMMLVFVLMFVFVAMAFFIVIVMMFVAVAFLVVIVMMFMAVALFIVVVMMMCFFVFFFQFLGEQFCCFHRMQDLLAVQCIPRGRDDIRFAVQAAQQFDRLRQLFLACILRAAENDGTRVFHLIAEELTEVLEIHLAFLGIHNSGKAVERNVCTVNFFNSVDDVAELADTGGLDDYTVRREFIQHFRQRFFKIADKTAADASGIHFGDLDARILQKTAVDTDLSELVFDQNDFFAAQRFAKQLFNERCFSGTKKTGDNIDFCHCIYLLSFLFQYYYYNT